MGKRLFPSPKDVQTCSGTHPGYVQWAPQLEADHPPPSRTEVKNQWNCISTQPTHLHGLERENIFNFTIVS